MQTDRLSALDNSEVQNIRYKLRRTFVSENENGTVTTTRFAQLLQELYPVTISDKKAEEVLASCSSIDTMDETAKEAYASFASGALAVDDSCKTANQRITRGQAV